MALAIRGRKLPALQSRENGTKVYLSFFFQSVVPLLRLQISSENKSTLTELAGIGRGESSSSLSKFVPNWLYVFCVNRAPDIEASVFSGLKILPKPIIKRLSFIQVFFPTRNSLCVHQISASIHQMAQWSTGLIIIIQKLVKRISLFWVRPTTPHTQAFLYIANRLPTYFKMLTKILSAKPEKERSFLFKGDKTLDFLLVLTKHIDHVVCHRAKHSWMIHATSSPYTKAREGRGDKNPL